ncbi:hypothetical protein [Sphingomonas glacialis]|uniref:Uncharacterized protein n=1 Tax=Sphingomonas glacialis TaxID=658225 RepID=A0A502FXP8_9SPHN|nr:hypothetical protein [Sphingomonas glacialis]TPG54229.1 hypothetical protein EAH76_05950 [Sphingomonas glacialis]
MEKAGKFAGLRGPGFEFGRDHGDAERIAALFQHGEHTGFGDAQGDILLDPQVADMTKTERRRRTRKRFGGVAFFCGAARRYGLHAGVPS